MLLLMTQHLYREINVAFFTGTPFVFVISETSSNDPATPVLATKRQYSGPDTYRFLAVFEWKSDERPSATKLIAPAGVEHGACSRSIRACEEYPNRACYKDREYGYTLKTDIPEHPEHILPNFVRRCWNVQ